MTIKAGLTKKLFFVCLNSGFAFKTSRFRKFSMANQPTTGITRSTGRSGIAAPGIERMHRRFLDVVRIELTHQNINMISVSVQAMMLASIGDEEISVRDLIERGYYLGSNASYNLKHLVDGGYVDRQTSTRDRRSARLKVSAKGRVILDALTKLNAQMAEPILKTPSESSDLEAAWRTLRRLEHRWSDSIRFSGNAGEEQF